MALLDLRAALQEELGITACTAMQLPAPLIADKSLYRLPVFSSFPVVLHLGPNVTVTPAADALHSLRIDLKVQQELLRHADIRTTMNVYTQAVPEALREANSKFVQMVLPERRNV